MREHDTLVFSSSGRMRRCCRYNGWMTTVVSCRASTISSEADGAVCVRQCHGSVVPDRSVRFRGMIYGRRVRELVISCGTQPLGQVGLPSCQAM